MSEILQSLKSDLLDRRLLPILVLLGLALAGAVAYAVLGGGGSSPRPVAATGSIAPPPTQGPALAVQEAAANPHAAVAETTDGVRYQHKAGAHDPFIPLPSPVSKTLAATTSNASSSKSSSSSPESNTGSSTTSSGGGGTTPSQPSTPAPKKPKVVHKVVATVSVLFGLAPTTPGQLSQLTPYSAVKRLEPLPSTSNPLIIFEGVSSNRKSAIFTLTREAILKGNAVCLPNASQCEAIKLASKQSEELSYLEPDGQTVAYELELESITSHEVSVAAAARLNRGSRAGAALLRRLAPPVQSELHFSGAKGVLFFVAHHGA
ncbi:MAG: hypothetical protein ACHQE6_01435 [Solirubrobacterales bacterium]